MTKAEGKKFNFEDISKILEKCEGNMSIKHGDFDSLVEKLDRFARSSFDKNQLIGENNKSFANKYLHPTILINKMADSIEDVVQ